VPPHHRFGSPVGFHHPRFFHHSFGHHDGFFLDPPVPRPRVSFLRPDSPMEWRWR
jgi:hypothetical protein